MAEEKTPNAAAEKPPVPTASRRAEMIVPKNVWGDTANRPAEERPKSRLWFNRKGEMVGQYLMGKTLGAGGIGTVRCGKHVNTGQKYAVKNVIMDNNKFRFIKREIAISRLLFHPNIARLHDVIYEDFTKEVYMVMDLVDGVALLDYIISAGNLKERAARPFFRQILSAVEYCHRNCIAHRDLKIENILIDKRGLVQIIDFGLSSLYNPETFLKTNCGSIFYAAPELITKTPYRGPEVDIWALGCILYVMLVGGVPFEAPNVNLLYERIRANNIYFPAGLHISHSAQQLIKRMLTVDMDKRATLDEVIAHPWVSEGYFSPPRCEMPERDPLTSISPQVVTRMEEFDLAEDDIKATLEKAVAGELTPTARHPVLAVYYLILEKLARDQLSDLERRRSLTRLLKSSLQLVDGSFLAIDYEEQDGADDDDDENFPMEDPSGDQHAMAMPDIVVSDSSEAPLTSVSASSELTSTPREQVTPAASLATSTTLATKSLPKRRRATMNSAAETPQDVVAQATSKPSAKTDSPPSSRAVSVGTALDTDGNATGGSLALPGQTRARSSTLSAGRNGKPVVLPTGEASGASSPPQSLRARAFSRTRDQPAPTPAPAAPLPSAVSSKQTPKTVQIQSFFSVATTSTKPPFLIKDELMRVLENHQISFSVDGYTLTCVHTPSAVLTSTRLEEAPAAVVLKDVHFSLTVVKVQLLNLHGIMLRRYSGDSYLYRNVCQMILADLRL